MVNTGPPLHGYESTAPEGRTVYVSNVPYNITDWQMQEFFSVVGTAVKIKLCGGEETPARFAFIEFASVEECHRAISLNGIYCCGRPLKISQSKGAIQLGNANKDNNAMLQRTPEEIERMDRTVYISNLPTSISEMQIVEFISLSGKVVNYKFCGEETQETRYAFFEFATRQEALTCRAANGTLLGGYAIKCGESKVALQVQKAAVEVAAGNPMAEVVSRTVYIGNIDPAISENEMKSFFEDRCGPSCRTNMLEGNTGGYRYGFVEFVDRQSAIAALQLNGQQLGAGILKVAPSKGAITKTANANATQAPGKDPNAANILAINNQAYALALQEENRKYQEFLMKKVQGDDSGRRRRRKSRSASPKRRRSASRSRSRSRGRRDKQPRRIRERDDGR